MNLRCSVCVQNKDQSANINIHKFRNMHLSRNGACFFWKNFLDVMSSSCKSLKLKAMNRISFCRDIFLLVERFGVNNVTKLTDSRN